MAERTRRLVAGVAAVRPGVADAANAILGLRQGIAAESLAAESLAAAHGFTVAPRLRRVDPGIAVDLLNTLAPDKAISSALPGSINPEGRLRTRPRERR